jgi:probable HAF family extracellular repeat protein
MRPLPTLGGNNGFATGANNLGQVAGWAENTVRDSSCVPPQVLQFRAVVWGPLPGQLTQLPPLPGDSVSSATALNDRGQVVGISGSCDRAVGRFSARHAVLWENGTVRNLGTLGGVAWNTPMAINPQGDVVGFSNVSASDGGSFNARAFLWTRGGGIQDLGTLPGDALSQALGINERRQVVGISCSAGFASCRAFLWQNGVMTDLNALASPGGPHLYTANDINDLGLVIGEAIARDTGASVAFTATPYLSYTDAGREAATQAVLLSDEAWRALLVRLGLRQEDLEP